MLILISSIMLGLSSNNFLSIWLAMELNLLFFMPILINSKSVQECESSVKYFLVQSLSSSIFLFSSMLGSLSLNSLNINVLKMILITSIVMKMAAAPLHMWMPTVVSNSSWFNLYIISVPQKILPLFIFMNLNLNWTIILSLSTMSIVLGTMGNLNQYSLKKLLAFSSISHISWILLALKMTWVSFLFYFLFYALIMTEVCFLFDLTSTNFISELNMKKDSSFLTMITSCKLLSLGGLPPFLGFYPKAIIVFNLMEMNFIWIMIIMLSFSMMSLFIYTRLTYHSLLMSFNSLKTLKVMSLFKKNYTWLLTSEAWTAFSTLTFFMFWQL
uniref:NADH-ubiquinone oxidoreductase chain 2 n=1 Tax=Aeolothrips indicus TaxID=2856552 RepID=A0A8F5J8F2_9NEOP|nr:NADH dehydrogenase subunit 2 [Aeolothrips indicus]